MDKQAHLLEIADPQDQAALKIRSNAEIKTAKAYNDDPSAANHKAWELARQGKDELIDRLWVKYVAKDEVFKDRLAVVEYLQNAGFKVKKTKIYQDAKAGKLVIQPDGTVYRKDVERYAAGWLKPATPAEGLDDIQAKKIQAEYEKIVEQTALIRHKREVEQGRYILRTEFEQELAARAGILEMDLKNRFRTACSDLVRTVHGDSGTSGHLARALARILEQALDEYARLDELHAILPPKSQPQTEDLTA